MELRGACVVVTGAAQMKLAGPGILLENTACNSAETGLAVAAKIAEDSRFRLPGLVPPRVVLVTHTPATSPAWPLAYGAAA